MFRLDSLRYTLTYTEEDKDLAWSYADMEGFAPAHNTATLRLIDPRTRLELCERRLALRRCKACGVKARLMGGKGNIIHHEASCSAIAKYVDSP